MKRRRRIKDRKRRVRKQRERERGWKGEKAEKISKREGATVMTSRRSHEEGQMKREKKTYGGQTVVAEEKWRFMLLTSQRTRLKSAITAAIRSAERRWR